MFAHLFNHQSSTQGLAIVGTQQLLDLQGMTIHAPIIPFFWYGKADIQASMYILRSTEFLYALFLKVRYSSSVQFQSQEETQLSVAGSSVTKDKQQVLLACTLPLFPFLLFSLSSFILVLTLCESPGPLNTFSSSKGFFLQFFSLIKAVCRA